jgi:hypothetical protein
VVNYSNYVNDNTYTKSSVDYKDNKFLAKDGRILCKWFLILEDNEMYNLKSNVKLHLFYQQKISKRNYQ